jgi:outer membrane protein OmpA-like peptidoglycan-associated protein
VEVPEAPQPDTAARPEPQTARQTPNQAASQPQDRSNDGPTEEFVMRIPFGSGSAVLHEDFKDGLREIAGAMQANDRLRLKLLAYAALQSETELFARRLSLSRSLAVRNFLIAEGIEQTRITAQVLGPRGGEEPGAGEDRVDAFVVR